MQREAVIAFAVRDEGDILESKLQHHLECGFSHFHIIDHGSVDACRDILAKYERKNIVSVIRKDRESLAYESWVDQLLSAARARNPHAYLAFCDTDEFIFPQKELSDFMDGVTTYQMPRFNWFPDEISIKWQNEGLFSTFRNVVKTGFDTSLIGRQIAHGANLSQVFENISFPILFQDLSANPKLFFPLDTVQALGPGAHNIREWREGKPHKEVNAEALPIRHYPMRGFDGLERRVEVYRELFKKKPNLPNGWGWQNRYLVHMANLGALNQVWKGHILPENLDRWRCCDITIKRQ